MAEKKSTARKKKTAESTRGSSARRTSAAASRGKTERKRTVDRRKKSAETAKMRRKKIMMAKEITMIIVLGLCILITASFFSGSLSWLKETVYKIFGVIMYCSPLLIAVTAWCLLFHRYDRTFLRRSISFVLMLFAVSGILSQVGDVRNGGLFGRLNSFMFSSFGKVGSIVLNIVLIAVAVILFSEITAFDRIEKKVGPESEQYQKNRQKKELQNEHRELIRQQKRLEREAVEAERMNSIRSENEALKENNELRREQLKENQDRFRPVYGIGNTTISDEDEQLNHAFLNQKDALAENSRLFGNYRSSGKEAPDPEKEKLGTKDLSFIPEVNIPDDYFGDSADAQDEDVRNTEKTADVIKEEHHDGDVHDEYERIVITANGNIRKEGRAAEVKEASAPQEEKADVQPEEKKPVPAAEVHSEPEKPAVTAKEYQFPPLKLLKRGTGTGVSAADTQNELRETAAKLKQTLNTFGVGVTITNISCGPTVTRYELLPEMGVKVSKIVSLTDDIKLNLAAADIRIEAPIPGKSAIGIEVPNKVKKSVVLRDLIETEKFFEAKSKLVFAAGQDIEGSVVISDIQKMPHVLVAGSTGSGKSVCINSIIMSILYHAKPTEVKMIMVDPKVVELSVYNGIPHLLLPVVTDPKKAAASLNWAVAEMERRYEDFARFGVRGIEGFNELVDRESPTDDGGNPIERMPQILIIVDELADLMMAAPGDVETAICRLAQKARAAGIHLVLATQRPSVDVITGLIKANIPSRIAFAVSSGVDSRTILDMNGAEKLLGMGDMLYAPAGASKPVRLQGTYVSDNEVKQVVDFILNQGLVKGGGVKNVDLNSSSSAGGSSGSGSERDEYYADAGRLVIGKEKASIGMLQRAFKLGFNRAARIVDQLTEAGVIGEEDGTKPRKVLMTLAQFEESLKD